MLLQMTSQLVETTEQLFLPTENLVKNGETQQTQQSELFASVPTNFVNGQTHEVVGNAAVNGSNGSQVLPMLCSVPGTPKLSSAMISIEAREATSMSQVSCSTR